MWLSKRRDRPSFQHIGRDAATNFKVLSKASRTMLMRAYADELTATESGVPHQLPAGVAKLFGKVLNKTKQV